MSYGSHMFQDLVEAGIFYCALWGDERTVQYDETFFRDLENLFSVICPERKELEGMFRVSEPKICGIGTMNRPGRLCAGYCMQKLRQSFPGCNSSAI